jgi:DNA processing protein
LTNAAVRVAIVGTRKPGAGVPTWTYAIARNLAAAGVPIVSGLAIGIDAQAHRGAVDAGAPTYAVLGSAVDEVFPHSNRVLAARIVEKGGALVSEYPPGVLPQKWHFPARNRIISGLCAVTLVAAAPKKSGALITAGFAAEQNRDVWVGGGPEPFGEGCERLAFDGAKVITGIECALAELGIKAAAPESAQKDNAAAPSSALAGSLARELGISF